MSDPPRREPADAKRLPDRVSVPAALMPPPHQLVLSRTERPRALGLIAQDLLTAKMMPPGVHGPVPVSEPFAGVWQTLTGQRCEQIRDSRIYRLGRVSPPAGAPGRLRPAAEADRSIDSRVAD